MTPTPSSSPWLAWLWPPSPASSSSASPGTSCHPSPSSPSPSPWAAPQEAGWRGPIPSCTSSMERSSAGSSASRPSVSTSLDRFAFHKPLPRPWLCPCQPHAHHSSGQILLDAPLPHDLQRRGVRRRHPLLRGGLGLQEGPLRISTRTLTDPGRQISTVLSKNDFLRP